MLVKIHCDYCNELFEKEKKYVNYNRNNGYKNYCSKECLNQSKSKSSLCKCANCNKEILVRPSDRDRSKSGRVYCSKSCAVSMNNRIHKSGENNPNFVNGLGTYRQKALNYYGAKCDICGYDIEQVLEVHHIDGNRQNNNIDNLRVLCRNHHAEYTFGIRIA